MVEEPHVRPIRYFYPPPITFLLKVDPTHMPLTIPSIFQYINPHALQNRVDYVRVLLTESPKKTPRKRKRAKRTRHRSLRLWHWHAGDGILNTSCSSRIISPSFCHHPSKKKFLSVRFDSIRFSAFSITAFCDFYPVSLFR